MVLFGASIQGIQDYIFSSNRLKEIVGASELIEQWTNLETFTINGSVIQNAAGHIRIVFDNKNKAQEFIEDFYKNSLKLLGFADILMAAV